MDGADQEHAHSGGGPNIGEVRALASCLYVGEVVHQRFAPRRHRLEYPLFQVLIDLHELPALTSRLRLFSHNRFNAFSLYDTDHGDRAGGSLRAHVTGMLAAGGLDLGGGRIRLLCMPRMFGHVFNPLSVYYCDDASGALGAMIYEVSNTFGQRHTYLIPAGTAAGGSNRGGVVRQSCDKDFYVSPFMDMEMTYDFALSAPGETIATTIRGRNRAGEPLIFAAFTGQRRPLGDRALAGALVAHPFQTLGVVAAIHWEAARLFAKGLRLRPRPAPPATPVTVVRPPPSLAA
jgi:DUF1365 family protein